MFVYTDEELNEVVREKLLHPTRPPAPNVPCHLRTVSMIALMMRKFEKAGSENYKKRLKYDFDKTDVISRLKVESKSRSIPNVSELEDIVYFIRKFDINWEEMFNINKRFLSQTEDALNSNEEDNDNIRKSYLYSLALKYLCRNTKTENLWKILHPSKILSFLEVSKNHDCKTELVWILCYVLESIGSRQVSDAGKVLDKEILKDIDTTILSDTEVSDEAKAFLLNLISSSKNEHRNDGKQSQSTRSPTIRPYNSQNRKPVVVSKTVQAVKSSVKDQSGDDVQMKVLSLANALKNRSRKIVSSETRKHFETIDDQSGSDQGILSSTWAECVNLYELACSGSKTLKKEDKDNYLPNKLFGTYFIFVNYHSTRGLYELATHRLIVSTLQRISNKQELNDAAIDALMKGVTTAEELSKKGKSYKLAIGSRVFNGQHAFEWLCDNIVHGVQTAHSEYEKLASPEFLKTFSEKIRAEVMKEEETYGWFGGVYKKLVPKESYDKDKVSGFVKKEIEELRKDVGQALYNSACRNKQIMTEKRLKIIYEYLKSNKVEANDVDEENFQTQLLNIIDVVTMSGAGLDSQAMMNAYLEILLANTTLTTGRSAANSMVRETKNSSVCEKFINEEVMDKLMTVLLAPETMDEIKICVIEIINNYLEQSFCKDGLCQEHLEAIISKILMRTSSSKEMIDNTLISILITAKKHESLPLQVIQSLITLLNESYGDYIILILSHCLNRMNFFEILLNEFLPISEKVNSECVVVETENGMVKIEQRNGSNSASTSIALLATQILLQALESLFIEVNGNVVNNLLTCVETNEDKQARIVSIKCLYLLSAIPKYGFLFSVEVLNKLESFVNSDVYLIDVYSRAAYVKGLLVLSSNHSDPVNVSLMDSLSSLFLIKGSLKIGEKDFVPEINDHVLKIWEVEVTKGQKFEDENIFSTAEEILYENKNMQYSLRMLQILELYTAQGREIAYRIPHTTIAALEYTLSLHELTHLALWCLQNVICNGQGVSARTLQIFIDNLQSSDNSRRRSRAFKVLDRARVNQDINDEAFLKLELVRAAYGLSCKNSLVVDQQKILKYIEEKCEVAGVQIPIDTLNILGRYIDRESTLKILCNASNQQQVISYNTLNKLVEMFNPLKADNWSALLIAIFENVARNNQTLSKKLLVKLQLIAEGNDEKLKLKVLSMFAKQVQKGEVVSQAMISKILETIACRTINVMIRKDLLGCIGSVVLYASDVDLPLYKGTLQQILLDGLMSDNINIQKLSVGGWEALMSRSQIDVKYLSDLVEICTDMKLLKKCDQKVLNSLLALLKSNMQTQNGFTENLKLKFCLADLDQLENDDAYLDQIKSLVENGNGNISLLSQNYTQLANILNKNLANSLQRKKKILSLLQDTNVNGKLSAELLDSIALLHETTNSKEMKETCVKLLSSSCKNEDFSGRISIILNRIREKEEARAEREKFINSSSSLCKAFKQDLNMSSEQIDDMLKHLDVMDIKHLEEIKSLEEYLGLVCKENLGCYSSASFAVCVEEILKLSRDITTSKDALKCYCQLLKRGNCNDLERVIGRLLEFSIQNLPTEPLIVLLECLLLSIPHLVTVSIDLTWKVLSLFECHLEHDDALVRAVAFAGLVPVAGIPTIELIYFKQWCNLKIALLSQQAQMLFNEADHLDILYVIVSLQFIDLNAFKKPKEVWLRELLICNIFYQLEPCLEAEKIEFYNLWLQIEEKLLPTHDCLAFLYQLNLRVSYCMKSLTEVNEILFVLNQGDSIPVLNELTNDDFVVMFQQNLKVDWCMRLIQNSVLNSEDLDPQYIGFLAKRLCKIFEAESIYKLFDCLVSIDDLNAFEALLEFFSDSKVQKILEKYFLMRTRSTTLVELKSVIEVEHLCESFNASSAGQRENLYGLFSELLRQNGARSRLKSCWTFTQLSEIIAVIKKMVSSKHFAQSAIEVFQIISFYDLSPVKYEECLNVLNSPDLLKNLNRMVVENSFRQRDSIRNIQELLCELAKDTSNTNCRIELKEYIKYDLLNQVKQIKSESLKSSIVGYNDLPICKWNEKHIAHWASCAKLTQTLDIVESIAVIKRTNFLYTKFHLTDTQIVASLVSLHKNGSESIRGKLLQVATGEGKSTIVCILAIVNALSGSQGINQVDIITSSPVLAERDAKDKARLFRMFDLTCSFNSDTSIYITGQKDCYKSDIVYGEVSQFQFDKLRDHYSQLGTLADRKFSVAIVDEVDAMLIDDSSKIARLSFTAAGVDQFQQIYVFLWNKLQDIQSRFISLNEKMFLLSSRIEFVGGKISQKFANEEGEIIEIKDLASYLREHGENLNPLIGEMIRESIDDFLQKSLNNYLESLIKEKIVKIPENFKEFFNKQRDRWIENAIEALNYQENIQYVIHDGQIKPVDYYSTGIVQSGTNWSNGLHQFLQLKHNLKMTSESFTTNFLSNISFINAYERLFGLTGTLGSEKAREVLKSVYKVELVNIPQLRHKQYIEYPAKVSHNESRWLQDICSAALMEAKKDRGSLIICETISHVKVLHERLKSLYSPSAVKTYTMNNMNQETLIEKVRRGDIVVATNLAGRGTDIHTDDIEECGGLHVIVTFMPQNQRVQDQAFGRTARQGKLGTGQMILSMQQLGAEYKNVDTGEVRNKRDLIESDQLNKFQSDELRLIQAKDEVFLKFCKFLNKKIRYDVRSKVTKGYWESFVDLFRKTTPTTLENSVIGAVEEQWAMFLYKLDERSVSIENADVECQSLLDQMYEDYQDDLMIKNLYYHIVIGNYYIMEESNTEKAQKHFDKVLTIIQDGGTQDLYGAAYVGAAWSSLAGGNVKTSQQKQEVLKLFMKALDSLSSEMAILNTMQGLLLKSSASGSGFARSELDKQLNVKTTILGSYLNSIQQCMRVIKKSLRLIHVQRKDEQSGVSEFFVDMLREKEDSGAVENYLDVDKDCRKKDLDWESKDSDKARYNLTFNDLTIYEETTTTGMGNVVCAAGKTITGLHQHWLNITHPTLAMGNTINNIQALYEEFKTKDQAMQTIDSAFYKGTRIKSFLNSKYLNSSYKGIELKLSQISLSRLRAFLSEDKEFEEELTAQSAIDQLKQERTYCNAWRITDSYLVDLEIVDLDNRAKKDTQLNKEINTIIKVIESKQSSDNLRYNFKIKEASVNPINKYFLKSDKKDVKVSFGVEFDGLDSSSARKISSVLCGSKVTCEIGMVLSKEEILSLLRLAEKVKFRFSVGSEDRKKFETLDKDELRERMEDVDVVEKLTEIKIQVSSVSKAEELISHFPDSMFSISYSGVSFSKLWLLLEDKDEVREHGRVASSLSFQCLDLETSKTFIAALRLEYLEFGLVFTDLTKKQAQHIIAEANLKQEAMEVCKSRSLAELFMKYQMPYLELTEFALKGIEYLLEISEKRFIPWTSICSVAILGVLQVVIGGVLIATGYGAKVGMNFISEGLSDLLYAYRSYSSRQFDWTDYAKQKAVSLIISICSVGFGELKEAGKGATNLVTGEMATFAKEAGTQMAEAGTSQFISNAKVIGDGVVKSGASLKSLAVKYIGVKAGEMVVREGLNAGVQCLTNISMDAIKPYIRTDIERKVQVRFSYHELKKLLLKMYTLDDTGRSKIKLEDSINKIVSAATNPERSFLQKQWNSIAQPLLRGVLGTSEKYGSVISMGFRIAGTLQGLYALQVIIDNLYEEILKRLKRMDVDTLSTELILQQYCLMEKEESRIIALELSTLNLDITNIMESEKSHQNELKKNIADYRGSNKQVVSFLEDFLDRFSRSEETFSQTIGMMSKTVSDKITEQIIRIIDSQLISPWSTYAVSGLTDKLSQRIQHCLVSKQENTDELNQQEERCKELKKKREDGGTLTDQEQEYLNNYDSYHTFGQQITANVKVYCEDYERFKIKYYSEHSKQNGKVSDLVKQYANEIRNGKPASMAEISTLSKMFGLKLKVTKDIGYQPTQEESDQGVKVIYILPGPVDENGVQQIGHALFVNDKGTMINIRSESSGENDCVYEVVSHILEKENINLKPEDLRDLTAQAVETNGNFAKVVEVENWVNKMNPNRANDLLFSAGLIRVDGRVQEEYPGELKKITDDIFKDVLLKNGDERYSHDAKCDTLALSLTSDGEILVTVNAKERVELDKNVEPTPDNSFYDQRTGTYTTVNRFGFQNEDLMNRIQKELMNTSINNIDGVNVRFIEQAEFSDSTKIYERTRDHNRSHAEMKAEKFAQDNETTLDTVAINKNACAGCHDVLSENNVKFLPEKRGKPFSNWANPKDISVAEVRSFTTDGTNNTNRNIEE